MFWTFHFPSSGPLLQTVNLDSYGIEANLGILLSIFLSIPGLL
jgi:hypothetical protein